MQSVNGTNRCSGLAEPLATEKGSGPARASWREDLLCPGPGMATSGPHAPPQVPSLRPEDGRWSRGPRLRRADSGASPWFCQSQPSGRRPEGQEGTASPPRGPAWGCRPRAESTVGTWGSRGGSGREPGRGRQG